MKRLAGLLVFGVAATALAADPPTVVNYQGVLRNASDKPLTGAYDMTFRFFDAATAGDELLVDTHAGDGAVSVSNGTFNTSLGGGTVADGSGTGTYTTLADVFRDFTGVWMEIAVGAETLTPRVRVHASAYALNASNLGGRAAAAFVDTTSAVQTKAGTLIVGTAATQATLGTSDGYGVSAFGSSVGGFFYDAAGTGVATLGNGGYAVRGTGNVAGGRFDNAVNGSVATLADDGGYGVTARGSVAAGLFDRPDSGTKAWLATNLYGVMGSGTGLAAGNFFHDSSTASAQLGTSLGYGISTKGIAAAGRFTIEGNNSSVLLGTNGGYGVYSLGSSIGGYFKDNSSGAEAALGYLGYGLRAFGSVSGALAENTVSGARVLLATDGGYGTYGVGSSYGGYFTTEGGRASSGLGRFDGANNYGIVARVEPNQPGWAGDFLNGGTGTYSRLGFSTYKIYGTGSVSFVQNHPADPASLIVYAAPEGDEASVYTRGSGRLENGRARVRLGETFASTANPDIGLTATVTPRGEALPLAVEAVSTTELVVRGPVGSDAAFDFMVWGLRIGFEEVPIVTERTHEAMIPSMAGVRDLYAARPDLRRFNALERYREMHREVHRSRSLPDLSRAALLREAVGEYDPGVDSRERRELLRDAPGARAEPSPVIALPEPVSAGTGIPEGPAQTTRSPGSDRVGAENPEDPPGALIVLFDADLSVRTGDLLAIDPDRGAAVVLPHRADDPSVIGVAVSDAGAGRVRVAVAGVAQVRAEANDLPIRPGDPISASGVAGHVRRAVDATAGAVVGKALEPLEFGTGTIRILVTPR